MRQIVSIYKDKTKNKLKVKFIYNDDLLDIMREHRGWWHKKEKAWQFPISKLTEIYEHLTNEKYNVRIIKLEEKSKETKTSSKMTKQKTLEMFDKSHIANISGHCKECKQYHFIGKDGLCVECSLKKK